MSIFQLAQACLRSSNPDEKLELTHAAASSWLPRLARGEIIPPEATGPTPIEAPGRPPRPRLVLPRDVPQRKISTTEGRAALLHAVVHIEFNAINLAWDAVYRFRALPCAYYADWIRIADDEARHFAMLRARLRELGYEYGDFDAHNGLWEMAVKTADDWVARMALVPRVLEARGLDVTPGMIERLRSAGDYATARLLAIILDEEVGHVGAGSRWFAHGCRQAGLEPAPLFRTLLARHGVNVARGPLNRAARLAAGFSIVELDSLSAPGPQA